MINELDEHGVMVVLKHARNSTQNVDFGEILVNVGEDAFHNIIRAHFQFEFNSQYAVGDEDIFTTAFRCYSIDFLIIWTTAIFVASLSLTTLTGNLSLLSIVVNQFQSHLYCSIQ